MRTSSVDWFSITSLCWRSKGRMWLSDTFLGWERSFSWALFNNNGPGLSNCGLDNQDSAREMGWELLFCSSKNCFCSSGWSWAMGRGWKQSRRIIWSFTRWRIPDIARCMYKQLFAPPWLAQRRINSLSRYEAVFVSCDTESAGSPSYPLAKSNEVKVSEFPRFLKMLLWDWTGRDNTGRITLFESREARIMRVILFFW